MKKLILLIFLIAIAPKAEAQIDTALTNKLQFYLNKTVTVYGNHGVSAFLKMANGQTWSGTAGLGRQNLPITDTTLFHGASTTKMNMAILMLLLAEDSLIDLDDSWHKYVSLNNAGIDTLITIRQLLNHTSGIADYLEASGSGSYITSDFNQFYTPQYILDSIVSGVPDFPAGTGFQYSNSNYVLAALIAETVTMNPLETELRTRIWNPLGMNHTYFGAYQTYTEQTAGVWWNFGSGLKNYSDSATTSMLSFGYGCGNIVSCPTDLALLIEGLLSGQLLNNQSLNEMLTFVPQSYSTWTQGYGLGIHHQNAQFNDTVIGHHGYYTNLTHMFHSLNYDFTLVTMSNTQTTWFGIFNPMYNLIVDYIKTIAVDQFENKIDLTIYPNPAKDFIRVEMDLTQSTAFEIYATTGKLVLSGLLSQENNIIDLSRLSNGLYLLKVENSFVKLVKTN